MNRGLLIALLCSLSIAQAAELGKIDGSPIKLGDTVENVKQVLNTPLDPEKDESPIAALPSTTTSIHLKTRGIWVTFNTARAVRAVRFDAPFKDAIKGVRIGDSQEKTIEKLGEPVKKTAQGANTNLVYYPDDVTTMSIVISRENGVETIFLSK